MKMLKHRHRKIFYFLSFLSVIFFVVFLTKNTRGAETTVTFTAVGDYGATSRTNTTLAGISQSGSQFNLALGDMSYSEITPESAWCDYVKSYLGNEFPFQLVVGNHEDDNLTDGDINNFAACLPDRMNSTGTYAKQYYFDYPQVNPLVRVIMVSPNLPIDGELYSYQAGTPRYTWLSNTIDEARSSNIKWVVVGMHKLCYSIGIKSCEITTDMMDLLIEKKVDLVLQGHEHMYQRSVQLAHSANCPTVENNTYNPSCVVNNGTSGPMTRGDGTVIVNVGIGGRGVTAPNLADPELPYFVTWNTAEQVNGFMKFVASSTQLDATFVPTLGALTDSFTIIESGMTPTPIPTPVPTSTLIFPATESATIKSGTPSSNYGTNLLLEVDSSELKDFLLKFDVSGLSGKTVVESKIFLYNQDASGVGGRFNTTTNDWSEGSVTWNSAPSIGGFLGAIGSVTPGTWYSANLGQYIQVDGTYSFRVNSPSSDGADYASDEDLSFVPYLAVIVENPDGTPVPTPTPTPTLTPTPLPTPTPSPTPTPVPTPTPSILIFTPTADAHVRSDRATTNYGTSQRLEVDGTPVKSSYIKFSVSGIGSQTVTSTKLRVYNVDPSNMGGNVRIVGDNSWSETGITWNNAPQPTTIILSSLGAVKSNNWYEFDLTPYVTQDGDYTFHISSPSSSGADYTSREGLNKPQLIIGY